ncbi:hypothetical protein MUK42_16385 [Musa troglodytarum]|uniref:Uncharacterized protein n=1 Tax=Musa troglodytarum TaxID=320322 RepID=A0A9E7HKM5_9LILI|nr:hypothetical protein MUK42_16385 [Musa troglodytarum]
MRCGDPESVIEPDPARPDPDRANRARLALSIFVKLPTVAIAINDSNVARRQLGTRSGADPCLLIRRG